MKYLLTRLIDYYLCKNGGCLKSDGGVYIVRQGLDFHTFCYGEGYKIWKNK